MPHTHLFCEALQRQARLHVAIWVSRTPMFLFVSLASVMLLRTWLKTGSRETWCCMKVGSGRKILGQSGMFLFPVFRKCCRVAVKSCTTQQRLITLGKASVLQ